MIFEAIAVAGALKTIHDVYEKVSAIVKGEGSISDRLAGVESKLASVVHLSDKITVLADQIGVRDITRTRQRCVEDLREVREALEPVQRAVNDNILSSAMIWTSEKMKRAMSQNPWKVLLHIQPVTLASPPNDPNLMPIIFEHGGVQFIGWQAQGTFPMLFDCEYEDLWIPKQPERIILSREQYELQKKTSIIAEKFSLIVVQQLGVQESEVYADASFAEDLRADSLDCIEILITVEGEFGIEFSEQEAEKMTTVGKAIEYIEQRSL